MKQAHCLYFPQCFEGIGPSLMTKCSKGSALVERWSFLCLARVLVLSLILPISRSAGINITAVFTA